ncbi:MAG: Flp family type IVb pilin [Candidatus Liberibacter ctenarytainae]|uniref:Flp family type IVb pilin n=1 Tax=Candidatus Liberibacter ctenarytainae TaxID=2020335 RepID=A0A937DGP4_9HYPH|nr:Flp family type IVb pilin [Candidatus Liberibacter ctenarytainae]
MIDLCKKLKKLIKDQSGLAAIEYGLLAALVSVAIIAGATAIGTKLNEKFNKVAEEVGKDRSR